MLPSTTPIVERRKPLILSSTSTLIDSLLKSSDDDDKLKVVKNSKSSTYLQLQAGILRCSNESSSSSSLDDSSLIGLSASLLKRLSLTSGSLVLVRNAETREQRIGRVVVLDRPGTIVQESSSEMNLPYNRTSSTMVLFPSCSFPLDHHLLSYEVAYLSPLLAFNLDLHMSCLKSLVHGGHDKLTSLFQFVKDDSCAKGIDASKVLVELTSSGSLPRFASHLRASFVKIPECGTIQFFKGTSSIEAEDRQEMIDMALHNYFKVDRYLSRGDVFCICINWSCKSEMCIPCNERTSENTMDNKIYFKVMAMEPSDEPVLCVNNTQTAFVLGGSVSSALPPSSMIGDAKQFVPLHGDTVKILASILTPPLCPSALSSKFRVSVLLSGLADLKAIRTTAESDRQFSTHLKLYKTLSGDSIIILKFVTAPKPMEIVFKTAWEISLIITPVPFLPGLPLEGPSVLVFASLILGSSQYLILGALLGWCGKRTVVRYVARRLGLHLVEYSCYDLMAQSERKISVALAHAFNATYRYGQQPEYDTQGYGYQGNSESQVTNTIIFAFQNLNSDVKINVPDFDGKSDANCFIDWLNKVDKMLAFKKCTG
ncbi:hypothetical protein GIB67_024951 [Kingdonia uniflora]|uniref:Uncharacterized protein n=1 Tax=Kingdonia uniflora TaxID=39325 RepID=A0A7J7NYR8_9MAGN|nr:hypothetical protein GIB67_024951 [Kingdonia uniflora]